MTHLYSDLEGLRLAVDIEERGLEFYEQAYRSAKTDEHKQLFKFLRDEEGRHHMTFLSIYEAIKLRKEATDDDYRFDPDVSRYITVLAETQIFPPKQQAAQVIQELNSTLKILRMALQAEKNSILLYDELADNAKFPDSRQVFLQLKQEEKTHVVKLREIVAMDFNV